MECTEFSNECYKESGCKTEIILVLANVYVQKDLFLKLSSVQNRQCLHINVQKLYVHT